MFFLNHTPPTFLPAYHFAYRFSTLIHVLFLLHIHFQVNHSLSVVLHHRSSASVHRNISHPYRFTLVNLKYRTNSIFMKKLILHFYMTVVTSWLGILLLQAGDVHPNPGPRSMSTSSTTSSCTSDSDSISLFSEYFSLVHYNIQSIRSKLDILKTELIHFDILAFSETWLDNKVSNDDIRFPNYSLPERKDRSGDLVVEY